MPYPIRMAPRAVYSMHCSRTSKKIAKQIPGGNFDSLYMLMLSFSSWFPPLQDTAQHLFKSSYKTLISQGAARPLVAPYPLDLLPGYLTRKEVPPVPDPCKQGLDLHSIVAPACDKAPHGPILVQVGNPTPVAESAVCRQPPGVGAGRVSAHARICAGGPETGIPTALRIFLDNLKVLESPDAIPWRRSWRQEMAAYLSLLSRDRPIAPKSSGSAASMNPHTRETVSVPAPVNRDSAS